MPESQAHGKTWERQLGLNVYKATEAELDAISYTAEIDVPHTINRLDSTDISIKTTQRTDVDLGDVCRFYKEISSGRTFHMTVVEYEQVSPTTKKLRSITEVDLTNSVELLFGTVTLAEIQALVDYVKAIPAGGRTVEHQATYKRMSKDLAKKAGAWTYCGAKVDSKDQRRVQARFRNFGKFLKEHPGRIIARSESGIFRGGAIQEEVTSTTRVRHRKTPAPGSAPHSPPI